MSIKQCILIILFLSACSNKTKLTKQLALVGNQSIAVFDNINLYFDILMRKMITKMPSCII